MTSKARGASYESFISQGWTDDLLVQHGLMILTKPGVTASSEFLNDIPF